MLVIRFARRGRKKQAFYDLVAAEKARPVKKKIVERLGYYDPLANDGAGELVFDVEKVKAHIANGAQLSQTVARLLVKNDVKEAGKYVKERASKPKKEAPKKDASGTVTEAPASTEDSAKKTEKKSE